jgi:hypothetical protein
MFIRVILYKNNGWFIRQQSYFICVAPGDIYGTPNFS